MMSKIKATAVVALASHIKHDYPARKFCPGRGGSNLDNVFLVDDGREDPNTTKAGHHWPASETPLNCRFAD